MILSAFPFTFHSGERHRFLTHDEADGLSCLLDRARQFGGTDDIFFLCVSTCSLLVRFTQNTKTSELFASGLAFKKQQESWIWIYLPSLLRSVCGTPSTSSKLCLRTENAQQADEWLQLNRPGLHQCARQFVKDTARLLHPHSVAFTHLPPTRYGDDSICWYRIEPFFQREEVIRQQQPQAADHCAARFSVDAEISIVPPHLTHTWRIATPNGRKKLGRVEGTPDWYDFAAQISSLQDE